MERGNDAQNVLRNGVAAKGKLEVDIQVFLVKAPVAFPPVRLVCHPVLFWFCEERMKAPLRFGDSPSID